MDKKNVLFWKQAYGEIKAIDLPQWYIEQDTRVYCCNEECWCKKDCELFQRYIQGCKTFGRAVERGCIRDAEGWNRPEWDKKEGLDYRLASFGMLPEQIGIKPCEHYVEIRR